MESRFPLGEELWVERITDETMLATTVEDRVSLIELCQRATAEEVGSVRLWLLYGDWVVRLFHACRPGALGDLPAKHGLDGDSSWSDEDRMVGAEVFGWDMMVDVWRQAVRATQWRIHDSHLIWDRYAELILEDVANGPNPQKVSHLRSLFDERLQIPHATWDQTFQLFSTFVTNYDNAAYEETMVSASRRAANAKSTFTLRQPYEMRVQAAAESGNQDVEWAMYAEYLDWEMTQTRKNKGTFQLCNALFERAVLRFATDSNLWEDYVYFLVDRKTARDVSLSPLTVLQRATRHCPWSGNLWAQFLLSSESENKPFHEVEEVKHKATSMGLMDIGGMEEVLKAYAAWCCYLNRRAFHEKATDEEADVAEVGIRSAIETVKELGEKKHGKDFKGDPNYRLQRIYVDYLSRSGLWDRARIEVWKALISSRGDSYEFWLRWYHWEMMYWFTAGGAPGVKRSMSAPSSATSVLRQGLNRPNLDWPEKVLEVYMDHVQGFEGVESLQAAIVLVRKVSKGIAKRRQQEADEQAAQLAQSQQHEAAAAAVVMSLGELTGGSKRKRDLESETVEDHTPKKVRQDQDADHEAMEEDPPKSPETSALKRDREHTTVIVKNLPAGISEVRVRQFFREVSYVHSVKKRLGGLLILLQCGQVKSLNLITEAGGSSSTATIEFESTEDVLAAQTKDMKALDGNAIEVQIGTGTTVFVTNFPPAADESYVRNLFKDVGRQSIRQRNLLLMRCSTEKW